jgi:hypothetical protein
MISRIANKIIERYLAVWSIVNMQIRDFGSACCIVKNEDAYQGGTHIIQNDWRGNGDMKPVGGSDWVWVPASEKRSPAPPKAGWLGIGIHRDETLRILNLYNSSMNPHGCSELAHLFLLPSVKTICSSCRRTWLRGRTSKRCIENLLRVATSVKNTLKLRLYEDEPVRSPWAAQKMGEVKPLSNKTLSSEFISR